MLKVEEKTKISITTKHIFKPGNLHQINVKLGKASSDAIVMVVVGH